MDHLDQPGSRSNDGSTGHAVLSSSVGSGEDWAVDLGGGAWLNWGVAAIAASTARWSNWSDNWGVSTAIWLSWDNWSSWHIWLAAIATVWALWWVDWCSWGAWDSAAAVGWGNGLNDWLGNSLNRAWDGLGVDGNITWVGGGDRAQDWVQSLSVDNHWSSKGGRDSDS